MTYQISDFKVGDEVVLMASYGIPVRCNSAHNPEHPCRSTIVKVGRTRVYGHLTGKDTAYAFALNEGQTGFLAVPLEEAKRLYRQSLAKYDNRSSDRIDELVNSL